MTDRPRRIPVEEIAEIVKAWPTLSGYGPHIAEHYGIPLASAHRWIAEARRRGLLGEPEHDCPRCGGTGKIRWGSQGAAA